MSILRPGDHPDELISAAVSGDLTDQEQARLDAHLGTCERCRQTLADWTEQRRLVEWLLIDVWRQSGVVNWLEPFVLLTKANVTIDAPWHLEISA